LCDIVDAPARDVRDFAALGDRGKTKRDCRAEPIVRFRDFW